MPHLPGSHFLSAPLTFEVLRCFLWGEQNSNPGRKCAASYVLPPLSLKSSVELALSTTATITTTTATRHCPRLLLHRFSSLVKHLVWILSSLGFSAPWKKTLSTNSPLGLRHLASSKKDSLTRPHRGRLALAQPSNLLHMRSLVLQDNTLPFLSAAL